MHKSRLQVAVEVHLYSIALQPCVASDEGGINGDNGPITRRASGFR